MFLSNSIKGWLMAFLSGIAVALGTVVFFLWKVANHKGELKRAEQFVRGTEPTTRDKVLEDLEAKRGTVDATVEALRDEVEKETKREVIDGFKKAFGVRPVLADDMLGDDGGGY